MNHSENFTVGSEIGFNDMSEHEYDEDEFPGGIDAGYTIKAMDGKFAIATKPCPEHETVWYTIIDFEEGVRGQTNLVFNMYDFEKQEDIEKCLADLLAGTIEISHRHRVNLSWVESEKTA
jgi:hypothetical protein